MQTRIRQLAVTAAGLGALVWGGSVWAHHPMGGVAPTTLGQGLLSGLAHPVIGLDHLAFILAIGVICALVGVRRLAYPVALIGATVLGALAHWFGASVPLVEFVIGASVIAAGVMLLRFPETLRLAAVPVVVAALFHGIAYGETIIGAEPMPVIAYLVGFGLIQSLLGGGAFLLTRWVMIRKPTRLRILRIGGGGMAAGVGTVALLLQILV